MDPKELPGAVRSTLANAEQAVRVLAPAAAEGELYPPSSCRAERVRSIAHGECLTYIAETIGNGLTKAVADAAREGASTAKPAACASPVATWGYRVALPVVLLAMMRGCNVSTPTSAEQQMLAAMASRAAMAAVSNAVPVMVNAMLGSR